MKVMDAIKTRRSVREYTDRPVEEEKLEQILDAARLAPSARNEQKWKIIAVTDPELRKQMVNACNNQRFIGEAPVNLVICAHGDRMMSCGQSARTVDCSICMAYMILEAVEQGLQSCWIGSFDPDKVREVLNIPDDYIVVAVAPLGYPTKDGKPAPKKSRDEVVVYNKMK